MFDVWYRYDPPVVIIGATWHQTREPFIEYLHRRLALSYFDDTDLVSPFRHVWGAVLVLIVEADIACGCIAPGVSGWDECYSGWKVGKGSARGALHISAEVRYCQDRLRPRHPLWGQRPLCLYRHHSGDLCGLQLIRGHKPPFRMLPKLMADIPTDSPGLLPTCHLPVHLQCTQHTRAHAQVAYPEPCLWCLCNPCSGKGSIKGWVSQP